MASSLLPGIPLAPGQPTATIAQNQDIARRESRGMMENANHRGNRLQTQDEGAQANYVIYVYNLLNLEHVVNQPPLFPAFRIHPCEPGHKFSVTALPAYVKEPYEKPGDSERFYKRLDGRKCATSLLNPDIYPSAEWSQQLVEGPTGNNDCSNTNLNAKGVFWSLTPPNDPRLESEIALFKKRVVKTMNSLVLQGDALAAQNDKKSITPMMHFAMDYFQRQAEWHTTLEHFVSCPNCGERIKEGISYHRNSGGDRCIIDPERYAKMVSLSQIAVAPAFEPAAPAEEPKRRLEEMTESELQAATASETVDDLTASPEGFVKVGELSIEDLEKLIKAKKATARKAATAKK